MSQIFVVEYMLDKSFYRLFKDIRNIEYLENLHEMGNFKNQFIYSLFHAIEEGDEEVVEFITSMESSNIARKEDGQTPITLAVLRGNLAILQMVLDSGADPNLPSLNNKTPLHLAVENNDLEMIKALLDAKAKPTQNDATGNNPIHIAAKQGKTKAVSLLTKQKSTLNMPNKEGKTALHLAAEGEKINTIKLLVKKGSNTNATDAEGNTASSIIKQIGKNKTKHEKKPDEPNLSLNQKLFHAVEKRKPTKVQELLRKGANPNAINDNHKSVMDILAETEQKKGMGGRGAVNSATYRIAQSILENGGFNISERNLSFVERLQQQELSKGHERSMDKMRGA